MSSVKPSPSFREWLDGAIETSGLPKREIARRMAVKHPRGVTYETIETGRRTINKILSGHLTPTQPTRDTIAEALERHDAPSTDDDEEDELLSVLDIQRIVREQHDLNRRLVRALRTARSS